MATSGEVKMNPFGIKAAFDAYDSGSTWYVVGLTAAGAAAYDRTSDSTLADLTGTTHGPTAVTVTLSQDTSYFEITLTDLSGTFTDNDGGGTTVALALLCDNGGSSTGTARQIVGFDYKPHSLAEDGTDDSVDFPSDYSFRIST